MRIITDKKDRFGNFPIWFNSHNLRDIKWQLAVREARDGLSFFIVLRVSA